MADPSFAQALVRALDAEALDLLAERLAPPLQAQVLVGQRHPDTGDDWLNSKSAAAYLGVSMNAIHKLTAARSIPFEQDGPGCRCWFKRSELDGWRSGGGARGEQPRRA
jgi:excisionase family DNA binding protein